MVGLIGHDGKSQNTGFAEFRFDSLDLGLIDFGNDDFDLPFAVGADDDLLRAGGVDAIG